MTDHPTAPGDGPDQPPHERGVPPEAPSEAPSEAPINSAETPTDAAETPTGEPGGQPTRARTWSTRSVVVATLLAVALGAGGGAALAAIGDGGSSAPGHGVGPGMPHGPGSPGGHDGFGHQPPPGQMMPSMPPGSSWQPRRGSEE